jgi:outer membrane protein OmpA-like peptidoglycan-associated protein/ABC-type taurine transport system substrate-binding protein
MNRTLIGALLLLTLAVVGAVAVKLMLPLFEESQQKATSDAVKTKGKMTVAMDNWIGYFILRSPEMKNQMRRAGYILECEDDKADYARRMERLNKGEIAFAAVTVDSFILNAAKYNYPGAVIMVIDESKGGDAILARKDRAASLDALKGKFGIKVAFTPNSPSHHLAKAAADHFSAPELLPSGNLRIETDGSEQARDKLLAGKADVAVCWEPDVSRAIADPHIVKILGTEDTERLIVDILVANRKFIQKNPDTVRLLLDNYFRVLKKYRDEPDMLSADVKKETGLSEDAVRSMLKGVEWANFSDNCEKWFGISAPGIYAAENLPETIEATVKILINAGDFPENPIPEKDAYRLINSSFLEALFAQGASGFTVSKPGAAGPLSSIETKFSSLDEAAWNALKEVGTLKAEPIVFQHGTAELDLLAKQVVDHAAERVKHYPNFRILVKGHTDPRGDETENLRLSEERAEAVARYLKVTYNISENRIRARGFGGTKPLPQKSDESRRAWIYRLPRVEIVLVREAY